MSKVNSFNNLPYDIYLKIANAAVEDLDDDSLPYLALRLICPHFTPIISQCIMDKWAQSKPTFQVLADSDTDRLERFLQMCKWSDIDCQVTHLTFKAGKLEEGPNGDYRYYIQRVKPKTRLHQCVSVLIACRNTLQVLRLDDAGRNMRQWQELSPFDNWASSALNEGFPAMHSLSVTMWYIPLLPALLVSSPLQSLTFVDTGFYLRHMPICLFYPQLEMRIRASSAANRHVIEHMNIEVRDGSDTEGTIRLLDSAGIQARHATLTCICLESAWWFRIAYTVQGSAFFEGCWSVAISCAQDATIRAAFLAVRRELRDRIMWKDGPLNS